jgi:hypothetical protein
MLVQRLTHTGNFSPTVTVGTGSVSSDHGPDRPRPDERPWQPAEHDPEPRRLGRHALLRRQPAARHDRNDPGRAGRPPRRLAPDLPTAIPTPFGNLLISPSFLLSFVVPNGTGSVQLPIPNDPNFADAHIYWQGIAFDLTNNVYGMTNGVDWRIGQQ